MDIKQVGTKTGKAGSYGAIGVLVEYFVSMKFPDLPGGIVTAACASAFHGLHSLVMQWRAK